MEEQDQVASIRRFRELIEVQPRFAESHYRLARLLERAGTPDEAYLHYVAARDLDGYPMRCLTVFQDVYRDVARGTAARSLTARLISGESADGVSSATICSRTSCTRR